MLEQSTVLDMNYCPIVELRQYTLRPGMRDILVDLFERELKPALTEVSAPILAYFVTENSANTFPALPVRESEHVFVWFSAFANSAKYEDFATAFAQRADLAGELNSYLKRSPQVLKLSAAARSRLRGI